MCVIVILKPGYTLPYNLLETAAWNNPDGFGLVLRDPKYKKLEVIRRCHAKGNDPKEIYDLLKDNEDIERYLHLRWKTEGDVTLENTQPFTAYYSGKRQVEFMHNGTLNDFRPKTGYTSYSQGVQIKSEAETASDSKKFNDEFLSPFLAIVTGENGKGDILDPTTQKVINKFWGISSINRGLLISSDQGPVLINKSDWKTIKDSDGNEFLASNDTYFEKLTRGPVFEKLKKEKEEADRKLQRSMFQDLDDKDLGGTTALKSIDLSSRVKLTDEIKDLMEDIDIWSTEGLVALSNMTALEFEEFLKKDKDKEFGNAVTLFVHLTGEFRLFYDRYSKLVEHMQTKNIDTDKLIEGNKVSEKAAEDNIEEKAA